MKHAEKFEIDEREILLKGLQDKPSAFKTGMFLISKFLLYFLITIFLTAFFSNLLFNGL